MTGLQSDIERRPAVCVLTVRPGARGQKSLHEVETAITRGVVQRGVARVVRSIRISGRMDHGFQNDRTFPFGRKHQRSDARVIGMGRLRAPGQQALYHGFRAIYHRILERSPAKLVLCVDASNLCKGVNTRLVQLVHGPHEQLTSQFLVAVGGMRRSQWQRMCGNEASCDGMSFMRRACEPLRRLRAFLGTPFRQ